MESWQTVEKLTVLDYGRFLRVEDHTIRLPNGRLIEKWPWVITPDYINVVAVTADHRFLFFRQTKYAVDNTTLAPTGGYIDPGETPQTAAQRELLEETGYAAPTWTNLGSYAVDGNRGCGTAHLFLAQDAVKVGDFDSDDLEEQELLLMSRAQVEAALDAGEFKLLPFTAVVALALRKLDNS